MVVVVVLVVVFVPVEFPPASEEFPPASEEFPMEVVTTVMETLSVIFRWMSQHDSQVRRGQSGLFVAFLASRT